jgi:hypothetical protein
MKYSIRVAVAIAVLLFAGLGALTLRAPKQNPQPVNLGSIHTDAATVLKSSPKVARGAWFVESTLPTDDGKNIAAVAKQF